ATRLTKGCSENGSRPLCRGEDSAGGGTGGTKNGRFFHLNTTCHDQKYGAFIPHWQSPAFHSRLPPRLPRYLPHPASSTNIQTTHRHIPRSHNRAAERGRAGQTRQ